MSKTALVTGASKGIGRAIALELAEGGYDLGINYLRHEKEAREVAASVRGRGRQALVVRADVGKKVEIDGMFDRFLDEFGHIDLLVNNAGVSMFMPFLDATEEFWDTITNIDWKGTYLCTACRAGYGEKREGRSDPQYVVESERRLLANGERLWSNEDGGGQVYPQRCL